MFFNNIIQLTKKLFYTYLLGLFIFFVFRIIYVYRFGEEGIVLNNFSFFLSAFIRGFRFDTVVLLYFFSIIFLINIVCSFSRKAEHQLLILRKINIVYLSSFITLCILLSIIDHQFYFNFKSHLNILVFGVAEENTRGILKLIWTDHPIILMIISTIIISTLASKIIIRIFSPKNPKIITKKMPFIVKTLTPLVFIAIYGIGARGSLGIFPLNIDDAAVCEDKFINTVSSNGIMTLYEATEKYLKQNQFASSEQILRSSGYKSIPEALSVLFNKDQSSFKDDLGVENLFSLTPKNKFLENNPPNVVFILMESFGSHPLNYHNKENFNLLGNLEKHLSKGILFKNFVSSTRGTRGSLENLLFGHYPPYLSHTIRRFQQYNSSAAFPFKNAGYKTFFTTSGKINEHNLTELLRDKYFDQFYGGSVLTNKNPNTVVDDSWGVFDEYLFEDMLDILKQEPKTPKFIFSLTISNHPPHDVPEHYKPFPIDISDDLLKLMMTDKEHSYNVALTYQYANNALGNFLTSLEDNSLLQNTIVAITGDHHTRTLFKSHGDNVPFLLFIPEKYLNNKVIDLERFGSHKDVFPTIYNLSLSNQSYFALGNDMLGKSDSKNLFFGVHEGYPIAHESFPKELLRKKFNTQKFLSKYYFAVKNK